MRIEDQILFISARQAFGAPECEHVLALIGDHALDWGYLWELSRNHGVAPLVYTNLRRCKDIQIPTEIETRFKEYLFQNVTRRQNTTRMTARAVEIFNQYGVEVMLLKGEALNLSVYEQAWYTFSEDVDFLARPPLADLAPETGAALVQALNELDRQRGSLQSNLEYEFHQHHDISMNGLLRVDFAALWQRAQAMRLDGHQVFIPAAEDLFLTTCIGSCRKRFFRLKALCDMQEILRRYPDLDWAEVGKRAQAYGCANMVYAALTVLEYTLGEKVPEENLAQTGISPVRLRLIRALVRLLVQRCSLAVLSPYRGPNLAGHPLNPALLLTYAVYTPAQVRRKLKLSL